MLRPRIIPCLLIHQGGLVKTRRFGEPKYVGDPINAVRIFNEKEVDELFVADIDASALGKEPNYDMIRNLAAECRMPLCYAGGVKTADQFERIVSLGVEKVAIGSAAIDGEALISEAVSRVGSQSIVAVLDVRKTGIFGKYEVHTHNGSKKTGLAPAKLAAHLESLGVGEIVVNNINRDGEMSGYDFDLMEDVRQATSVPLTALGGAGELAHLRELIDRFPIIGAAAGSLFVFKGKYRAVLINYPVDEQKAALIGKD
ncbi:AglZ/HisF2 family acetamidino modification protein [Parerythrobacter jejuensis]|uniref:Imidazole glycerol phosphate synthase subunit HisF n=1 Tax=Parerythrobacter jejuensis TaxID=795812 RepID=A0A845B3U5_9SPHN|nr:AglZ/HisF2 family acetamidino modification protein [Parerythrobacter jejuensis]MXP30878.1 imidazole glycerol phosphate synthase subunit HisF [Parerythrobacter jejuensis]MXP33638.1 imidazole glycerol phosphate synthase subunit HisF [Parerythrobacter jejuensis]